MEFLIEFDGEKIELDGGKNVIEAVNPSQAAKKFAMMKLNDRFASVLPQDDGSYVACLESADGVLVPNTKKFRVTPLSVIVNDGGSLEPVSGESIVIGWTESLERFYEEQKALLEQFYEEQKALVNRLRIYVDYPEM